MSYRVPSPNSAAELGFGSFRGDIVAMNKHLRKSHLTPYEADYSQWCTEQGALLREGDVSKLDRDNLAEEIESLVRSDKREIKGRLNVILVHLLKYEFQPQKRKVGCRTTLREQRRQLAYLLKESPSLRSFPARDLSDEYESSRYAASDETKLPLSRFPIDCPYTINQVLDLNFLPGPSDTSKA